MTLVELLIVVVCLAIVGALALPTVGTDSSTRLAAAARLLVADLEYAQADSLSNGDDPRLIVFNTTTHTWSLTPRSTPATPLTNPVGNMPYATTFGQGRARALVGVTFGTLSVGGDNQLGFGAMGELDQASNATIQLRCGARSVTLTLDSASGQVSVGAIQ